MKKEIKIILSLLIILSFVFVVKNSRQENKCDINKDGKVTFVEKQKCAQSESFIKTCSEQGGKICGDEETCSTEGIKTSDTNMCCTGICGEGIGLELVSYDNSPSRKR